MADKKNTIVAAFVWTAAASSLFFAWILMLGFATLHRYWENIPDFSYGETWVLYLFVLIVSTVIRGGSALRRRE